MMTPAILMRRISAVRKTLWDVRPMSVRDWTTELLQEPTPEASLMKWESVALAYSAFFEARTPTAKTRDQALRVLLDCSAGRSEAEIHRAAYKSLRIAEIKSLIAHYTAADNTTQSLMQMNPDSY